MTVRSPVVRLLVGFVLLAQVSLTGDEPVVRIGIERQVDGFTLESAAPFTIEGRSVQSARFSTVITLAATGDEVDPEDLDRRMAVDIGDTILVRPLTSRFAVEPGRAPLAVNGRRYRGRMEIRGAADGTFTVINELPLEAYLGGVVPNELGPDTFPELEALKAQAIAARTYIVRNRGQYAADGYDICATDQCQVYRGLDTEHPMATEAVEETRGMIATYDGEPINALYSSTCGGQTEDAENVFGEAVPYLVSTMCHYEHPEPQPFASSRAYATWEEGLLGLAGVSSFGDAGRFLGIGDVGEPEQADLPALASFIRSRFFPDIPVDSDEGFLQEQGIFLPLGPNTIPDILVRLLVRKNAFQWRDARLVSWDGEVLNARVGSRILAFRLRPDAALFRRVGEARIPVDQGAWIGGESMELLVAEGPAPAAGTDGVADPDDPPEITALVFRDNPAGPFADRYSPVARWQVRRSRQELDTAVRGLNIGGMGDIVILERGPSNRVVEAEIRGTSGNRVITGPRLRTLFGLRDSLVFIDEERNRRGELIGMSFFGSGWGHGVGLCQVGAYGMALDGASAEEILTTYYRGIEVERVY